MLKLKLKLNKANNNKQKNPLVIYYYILSILGYEQKGKEERCVRIIS